VLSPGQSKATPSYITNLTQCSSLRQLRVGYKPVTALTEEMIRVHQCSNNAQPTHPGACKHCAVARQNDNYVQIVKLANVVNEEMTQTY
jgi:hypothetical protein